MEIDAHRIIPDDVTSFPSNPNNINNNSGISTTHNQNQQQQQQQSNNDFYVTSRMFPKHVHKRFASVQAYVDELAQVPKTTTGLSKSESTTTTTTTTTSHTKTTTSKAKVITKVLIANNGVAAVKAIRSVRRWAYDVFGNEKAITFVVMATPEDFRANAEYIRMADVIVDVPGGSNNHNYANVTLIVELARLHGVHAVWAGWGHASENPTLPDELSRSKPPIQFIGPSGAPMRALGDKIGSTIIAQSSGVPCIDWNGSHIRAEYDIHTGSLPEHVYEQATVSTATQAEEAAQKLGFPVMIKASEGGGGKGIRRVNQAEDVGNAYRQVCGEVPGSPIFIMKLSQNSRHLEVQLLADEYGNAIALNGRDCSVQRRHQKIIEEGPPVAAAPKVWQEMEKAAVALAHAVHYTNAGTVEYLYSETDAKFYFLELNPRLQVEHPVTEMITRVNLPAAQLQVAMGLPLYHIPEIRELYGHNRYEDHTPAPIDFNTAKREEPNGHCIAVRITAENAEAGFKPTSGGIQELNFRSTPSVWGYFSMDSSGSIHEFADSQFGHLFARGSDREHARRNMVLALKELSIRGDISTTVDYVAKLMELDDYISNKIDTAWLDGIIAQNVYGMAAVASGGSARRSIGSTGNADSHVHVVVGATILAFDKSHEAEKSFLSLVEKGQLPSRSLLKMKHKIELILSGMKYKLTCVCNGPDRFSISIHDDESKKVSTTVRVLSDGGYLIAIGGQSYVAYVTARNSVSTGMRINVGGASVAFSPDYDPTCLRSDVAGKLVKRLKPEGSHVKKGEAYAEIEVMKMFMPLKVEESGIISWRQNEGASLQAGDLLATVELDSPENVAMVSVFEGELNVAGWTSTENSKNTLSPPATTGAHPHLQFRSALDTLQTALAGYFQTLDDVNLAWSSISAVVTSPLLPVCEVEEQMSVLNGRIPSTLFDSITNVLSQFKSSWEANEGSGIPLKFPATDLLSILRSHIDAIEDASEKQVLESVTTPLRNSILPYSKSKAAGVPGAERILLCFEELLRKWIAVERCFIEANTFADAVENLRRVHKTEPSAILNICRAHEQLSLSSMIVRKILGSISDGTRIDLETTSAVSNVGNVSMVAGAESLSSIMPVVADIGSIGGNANEYYAEVALKARKLLMQASMPSLDRRKERILSASKDILENTSSELPREAQNVLAERSPIAEVLFSLLKSSIEPEVSIGLVELYLRHLYRPYCLKGFEREVGEKIVKFTFLNKRAEGLLSASISVTSMTELTRAVSSGSLGQHTDTSEPKNEVEADRIPASVERTGICALIDNVESLQSSMPIVLGKLPQYGKEAPASDVESTNVLYFIVNGSDVEVEESNEDVVAIKCREALEPFTEKLKMGHVRRVSLIFDRTEADDMEESTPVVLTFRAPNFHEEVLYRNIDPSLAPHLELSRIAANFNMKSLGSQHSPASHVHLYACTPRPSALVKDKGANRGARVFARALNFELDFSSSSFERMLVDALNAIDLCSLKFTSDNHLSLSLVSDLERNVLDPVNVEQIVAGVVKRHSERISKLGIIEVETRIVCCLDADSPPIAIRLFSSNPTGFVQVMNTYVEAASEKTGGRIFKLVGGTKASLASSGDSSWDGLRVDTPYPLIRPFDAQRKAALSSSDTVYCYDLPALFEAAVEQQWQQAAEKNKSGAVSVSRPPMVMYTTELVVKKKNDSNGNWTMQDYHLDNLEIVQEDRGAGGNDVGVVAWLVVLRTVEYPNGRQVVLIANDITVKAGSFGTREDIVFKMASEFAREKRIPRLFIAANSGARIGLSNAVKEAFNVAFKDPSKPENGFDFLFVEKDVYEQFTRSFAQIRCVPVLYEGREVYRITDIIGKEPDLGVENLKGSGLIAGETSVAYREIFTMTVVLGRTVGIGAYLVRLGHRTIQKTAASPIILTGYQALNKLMGVDVYSSNEQIGGPGIMYSNGISHQVAQDHLLAVKSAVDWLSYVPSYRGALLPITDIRGLDDVERKIGYKPTKGAPYDPRLLLTGEESGGEWYGGLFDRGSFTESLSGWAKTVVVGRVRLGGIPMGVIITENRTVESVRPADPADLQASESVLQEAGGVWFPNSAYKTAQSINDFRVEDLPLMVIANWRGFSGGQRDMFDEVLKYGSMIVDAFTAYEQPVFVFIPPFGEIRGGAWVVLDASINSSVMEMYATAGTARGNVLEPTGAASVKYRTRDLVSTMHRLDDKLKDYSQQLKKETDEAGKRKMSQLISAREKELLPVYEQISVQFCELHDTPGRMKAVGVIEREVEWESARSFFYWRLRRKLAEFDLRRQLVEAGNVGRGVKALTPVAASSMIRDWFLSTPGMTEAMWSEDKPVLSWMAEHYASLEKRIAAHIKHVVTAEVVQVMSAGGNTAKIGTSGIVEGLKQGLDNMNPEERNRVRQLIAETLQL